MMIKMSKIAELQEYKDWELIKRGFIAENNIPIFSIREKELFSAYKFPNDNIISYDYLTEAIGVRIKTDSVWNALSPVETIETIRPEYSVKTGQLKNKVYVVVNGIKVSPASIHAYYSCVECLRVFRVECNFVKWAKYFRGPVCKSCKKKLTTKTDSYWNCYKLSMNKTYGCDFPLQNASIHNVFKKSMMEKYGVHYSGQSHELLQKSYHNTAHKFRASKQEVEFAKCIIEVWPTALTYLSSPRPKVKCLNAFKYPDIIIGNLIIEYYGDYWHMNPELYDPRHVLPSGLTAQEKWEEDEIRLNSIKDAGYRVIIVWEKQWKENSQRVLTQISEAINVL